MSIRIRRMGFIGLLVIALFEVFFVSNGAVVSIGTIFGVCSVFGLLHLLGINIWNKEKSLYIKDLSFSEKVLAVFMFVLIIVWFFAALFKML